MKLISIRLQNFRQYYGEQELDFSGDRRRNVTVIHGVNGAGKTSLFLALNWCLYGDDVEEIREWKEKRELRRLVSKEAIANAEPLEPIQTSVEIVFTHGEEKYRVARTLVTTKQPDESLDSFETRTMQIAPRIGTGAWKSVSDSLQMGKMNAILPSSVRTYFLFDGEKIDDFAKPEAGGEVRFAIYNVMKLEILERGMKHLEDIAREYRSELKNVACGEISELLRRDEDARKDKTACLTRKEELVIEIKAAHNQIEAIEQRLGQMQNAKALQERRTRLQRERDTLIERKNRIASQIRRSASSGYFLVASRAIDDALGILEEKRERGEIPGAIRQQFIQDLLERQECICGHCLTPDSEGYIRLTALLSNSLPGSLEDDVLTTSGQLSKMQGSLEAAIQSLKSDQEQHAICLEEIEIRDEELEGLSEQLKDSPHEEISQMEKKRTQITLDINRMHNEQGRLDEKIEALTKISEQLSKEIEKADKDRSRENLLTQKMMLAQRAADAIEATQGQFADEMRKKVVAKTQEIFRSLIWKESHFHSVSLDENYQLEVTDRYGLPSRADFSAGERQVLSLSFITAMSRVSIDIAPDVEEGAPLVLDTPFGRLSSAHRNSITQHLPDLAPQLVLFVTDEELRDQALQNLAPRIGAEYRLTFDQATSCTSIVRQ